MVFLKIIYVFYTNTMIAFIVIVILSFKEKVWNIGKNVIDYR